MAGSLTITSPPFSPITPMSPTFNLTVPKPDETKLAPWEGLLMGDPGPDYDQRESRRSLVRYMLYIGKRDGVRRKMANWRDNDVFVFHPDDEVEMRESESAGKNDMKTMAEVGKDEGTSKNTMKGTEKKASWGMDEEVTCWESTTEKEKKDSKTETLEPSFGADQAWTTSRVTVS